MNEDGFRIEDEFRAMFAERSAQVAQSPEPYGRLRQRIITARRRRRQRVGGAAAALLVVAVGAGAWTSVGGSRGTKTVRPAGPVSKPGAVRYAFDDGARFGANDSGYVGYMKKAADAYLAGHGVTVPANSSYTIVTTFNREMMDDAIVAADQGLWKQPESAHLGSDVHLAFAAVDPATGQVKAFYSGVDGVEDFTKHPVNAALDGQVQIGNLILPITMAKALENGFTPESREPAANTRQLYWPIGATGENNQLQYMDARGVPHVWPPENDDAAPAGGLADVSLRQALALSLSAPFADLEMEPTVTPQGVYNMGTALGLTPGALDFDPNPALTLGVTAASPLRMADAYAAFPAGGLHREPIMVGKVLDAEGNVVWQPEAHATQAMSEKTAKAMVDVMRDAVLEGTASGNPQLRALVPDMDPAGKTSTTDFGHSAWFDGFNRKLSTAVALYRQSPDGVVESLATAGGGRVNGVSFPTTVWAKFMAAAAR